MNIISLKKKNQGLYNLYIFRSGITMNMIELIRFVVIYD